MENVILEAAGLGTGAMLAVIMFFVYRRDKSTTEDRLTNLLRMDIESRDRHTKAVTKLTTTVKRLNGRMK